MAPPSAKDLYESDPSGPYLCVRIEGGPENCYFQVNNTVWPIKAMWFHPYQKHQFIIDEGPMDFEEYLSLAPTWDAD